MTLSDSLIADYKSRFFVDLAEGYPFPQDLVPEHATVTSRVPFITPVSSFCDLLQSGGDFTLLRRLWGQFCPLLGTQKPDFSLSWSCSESVVSCLIILISSFCVIFPSFFCFCYDGCPSLVHLSS